MYDRMHCPRHEEKTPSCVIYPTHAYCYGGCGKIPLEELGVKPDHYPTPRPKEDLVAKRKYIETLPKKAIRGFDLPYDDLGYYLLFDGSPYYKLRLWDDNAPSRYQNPTGHSQPLFVARRGKSSTVFLVEGEINSLCVAEAFPDDTTISPGSAGEFLTERFKYLLTCVHNNCTLVIVVDRDGPGVAAAIAAKSLFMNKSRVHIALMQDDANEVLVKSGKEELRKTIRLQAGL